MRPGSVWRRAAFTAQAVVACLGLLALGLWLVRHGDRTAGVCLVAASGVWAALCRKVYAEDL